MRMLDAKVHEGCGVVSSLSRKEISGWIIPTDENEKVVIKVNGHPIATTAPAKKIRFEARWENFGFSRKLGSLWKYLGTGDQVTFEYAGKLLPVAEYGFAYVRNPKVARASQVPEMLKKMEEGFVFDKYGKFKLSIKLDTLFTQNLFGLFEQVAREIREKFSLNLFPTYGTMLGAVREGDFIGHDNDFDTTYISRHSEPEEVRKEFMRICAFLIERGYDLKVKKTHTWVRVPGTAHKFDIFFSYFNEAGMYEISYGTHGPALPRSDDFDAFVEKKLNDLTIQVPKNNEDMLAQIYGTSWRIPNAGFKHKSSTRHWDKRYHLTVPEISSLYWKQFYRDNPIAGGSPFAMFIAEKLRRDSLVVELGCGSGRDSVYFAQHGHTVFASDRADEALDQGRTNAGSLANIAFEKVDAADAAQVRDFFTKAFASDRAAGDKVLYMRFFLHSVTKSIQDVILDAAHATLPPKTMLALEFRTEKDADEKHVFGSHYRRYIPMAEMTEILEAKGFTISHAEESRGLSPYQDEDPFLCRIIATRS
ncbi:MAG: class I SAM-dependent methyltransferase [Ramlibacter sp.]